MCLFERKMTVILLPSSADAAAAAGASLYLLCFFSNLKIFSFPLNSWQHDVKFFFVNVSRFFFVLCFVFSFDSQFNNNHRICPEAPTN